MCNAITHLRLLPRKGAILLIRGYQATLSPDHGPLRHLYPHGYCRHTPTCSEYGKIMIGERGLLTGSLMLLRRLISCNPWKQLSERKIMEVCHGAASQR